MNNVENEEDFNNDLRDIIKAQNGNEDIMEQLIEKNKGLIWSIIRRFKDRGGNRRFISNWSTWFYKKYKKVRHNI